MFTTTGTPAITNSDYQMIFGEWSAPESSSVVRCYKRCTPDELMTDLWAVPWHVFDIYDHMDDEWNYWTSLFLDIVNKHTPLVKVRRRKGRNDDWIDAQIRQLMRSRNYFRRKHWSSNAKEDWD